MAKVTLRSITKTYGTDKVVDGVSLEADEGEFVVLLGPSGCGKTTTLRIISGLESASSGDLLFDDRSVSSIPPEDRNVGMVFQNYALYPHMTVSQNLSFGLESRKTKKDEIRKAVQEVCKLLELDHVMTHKPKELSGGQRQRVALGRALIRQPAVFLMDEPLSNLDANLRERMRSELAQLHRRLGITTFYVTHDQGEALTLSDKIVVLNDGHVQQIGTSDEVYKTPANSFVAKFIGSPGMNLLDLASLMISGMLDLGSTSELKDVLQREGVDLSNVLLGVRPEHLELSDNSSAVTLYCEIETVEKFGSHNQINGFLYGDKDSLVVAKVPPDTSLDSSDAVKLYAPYRHLHFFEKSSGKRIEVPNT